jgi:hypothetical protein
LEFGQYCQIPAYLILKVEFSTYLTEAKMIKRTNLKTWLAILIVFVVMVPTIAAAEAGTSSMSQVSPSQAPVKSLEVADAIGNAAIFQNSSPWGSTWNQDILAASGISYTIFGSADMGVVDLSPYDKVIISSVQGSSFYTALEANRVWFEGYVTAGGILDIHSCTLGSEPMLPGGFVFTYGSTNDVTIVDPCHPILTTPHLITDSDLDNWGASTHGYFGVVPAGAYEIIEIASSGQPCAMELTFGAGRIFVTSQTIEFDGASYNYLENTILYELYGVGDDLSITPPEGFISSGEKEGPFDPYYKIYTLTNNGLGSLDWTVSKTQPWLDMAPTSGTLNPGGLDAVIVLFSALAYILEPGTYNDTITFTNITSGIEQNKDVALVVLGVPSAGMVFFDDFPSTTLDPANWTITCGAPTIDDVGIAEPSEPYSLRLNGNPDGGDCVESGVIDLSGRSYGQVELIYYYEMRGGGEHPDLGEDLIFSYWNGSSWVVSILLPADALHAGFKLQISNIGTAGNFDDWFVDDVSIVTLDDLGIAPLEGLDSSGHEGGPFSPSSKTYTLTNEGVSALSWTASKTQNWLDIIPNGGTLNPGTPETVVVSLNTFADTLDPCSYADVVTFTNITSGFVQTRDVTLEVIAVPGEIEVSDSIPPPDDLDMPFGDIPIGLSRTEQITVCNTDSTHDLIITGISPPGGQVIEGFEDGDLSEYTHGPTGTHTVTSAAARDGYFGLESEGEGDSWIYRTDATVLLMQGDTVSYWVKLRAPGRAQCGFGASAAGTYWIVAAPNTNELLLQLNYTDIGAVSQVWTYDKWYRLEVE